MKRQTMMRMARRIRGENFTPEDDRQGQTISRHYSKRVWYAAKQNITNKGRCCFHSILHCANLIPLPSMPGWGLPTMLVRTARHRPRPTPKLYLAALAESMSLTQRQGVRIAPNLGKNPGFGRGPGNPLYIQNFSNNIQKPLPPPHPRKKRGGVGGVGGFLHHADVLALGESGIDPTAGLWFI